MGDTDLFGFEGKVFEFPDTVHGTGRSVWCMCVQNDTGSAITVARKFASLANSTSMDFGGRVGAFPNATAGGVVVALDDAYTVGATIADNDLFWVLVYGPCSIATGASVTNLSAGISVSSDNAGLINNATGVAAGAYVAGTLDYAASYTANSTAKVLVDCRNLNKPPAAG